MQFMWYLAICIKFSSASTRELFSYPSFKHPSHYCSLRNMHMQTNNTFQASFQALSAIRDPVLTAGKRYDEQCLWKGFSSLELKKLSFDSIRKRESLCIFCQKFIRRCIVYPVTEIQKLSGCITQNMARRLNCSHEIIATSAP